MASKRPRRTGAALGCGRTCEGLSVECGANSASGGGPSLSSLSSTARLQLPHPKPTQSTAACRSVPSHIEGKRARLRPLLNSPHGPMNMFLRSQVDVGKLLCLDFALQPPPESLSRGVPHWGLPRFTCAPQNMLPARQSFRPISPGSGFTRPSSLGASPTLFLQSSSPPGALRPSTDARVPVAKPELQVGWGWVQGWGGGGNVCFVAQIVCFCGSRAARGPSAP